MRRIVTRPSQPFVAFPHALDLNEPCMVFCLDHLAGKHRLGAVETSFGRDGIASTCVCSASAPHPADRQDKEPVQMLHWNLLGKNCILPTLRAIRAAALPAFRRFPRVICPASSGSLSYGGQVASRNDVGEHCSPDVAQRNPGLTRRRPRIALRSIRATAVVICPSGCFLTGASSYFSDFPKNILVPIYPKSHLELSHPTPPEGRIAIVTDAGCGCGGRGSVLRARGLQGRSMRLVSDRQHADERRLQRTAKSCGPDAPTLASSLRMFCRPYRAQTKPYPQATVAKEPGHRGG